MKPDQILIVPRRTSYTPARARSDLEAWPLLWDQPDAEVEISVVFTADLPLARALFADWKARRNPVKIGGPALDDPGGPFIPGRYVKPGITFTSRGCPNACPWCYVGPREGKLRTLDIQPGNVIQDNNFLACPKEHRRKVYSMLRRQKAVAFRGGLEACRLTDWDLDEMRSLRLSEL